MCRCFRPKVVVPESSHHGQPDVPADFDKFVFRHWPFSNTVCLLCKNTCYGIFRCNFWLGFQRLCYFVVRYCSKSSRHRYRKMKMITLPCTCSQWHDEMVERVFTAIALFLNVLKPYWPKCLDSIFSSCLFLLVRACQTTEFCVSQCSYTRSLSRTWLYNAGQSL